MPQKLHKSIVNFGEGNFPLSFKIENMIIDFSSIHDNEYAHSQVKQLMEQKCRLTIELTDEPCAWISARKTTGLRYILNRQSWSWLLAYLQDGKIDDFRVFPLQTERIEDFQIQALKELIRTKCNVFKAPFLREVRAYVTLIVMFPYGKIKFKIKFTNNFMDYLYDNNIC